MTRRTALSLVGVSLLLSGALLAAHPGHEYHVEGVVAKVRAPHFEVKDAKGNTESFMIVPGTDHSNNLVAKPGEWDFPRASAEYDMAMAQWLKKRFG